MKSIRKARAAAITAALFLSSGVSAFAAIDPNWYADNGYLLTNNSAIFTALRSIGWWFTKFLCTLSKIVGVLYDSTFALIDITRYGKINDLITSFRGVLLALIILSVAYLGLSTMLDPTQKRPVVRNIIISMLTVTVSITAFNILNDMAIGFKDEMIGKQGEYTGYALVDSNIYDLVRIDKEITISNLNFEEGKGFGNKNITGAGITGSKSMNVIDIKETLNFKEAEKGKELYGWSNTFDSLIQEKLTRGEGQKLTTTTIFDGVLYTTIGNEFYYRYKVNWLACWLQLGAYIFMMVALSYKNVRIMFELVTARILAYLHAADITSGERLKQILLFIRDTYIVLGISVLSVKLYPILTSYASNVVDYGKFYGVGGALLQGIISLFIAFCVIDGPNIAERLLGMDAGLGRSMARTMGAFAAARGIGRGVAAAGKGAFNKAKDLADKIGNNKGDDSSAVSGVTAPGGSGKGGKTAENMDKEMQKKADQKESGSKGLPQGYGEEEPGGQRQDNASAAKDALENNAASDSGSLPEVQSSKGLPSEFMNDGSGNEQQVAASSDKMTVDFMEKGHSPMKPKTEHIPEHKTITNSNLTSGPATQKLNKIGAKPANERPIMPDQRNSKTVKPSAVEPKNGDNSRNNTNGSSS